MPWHLASIGCAGKRSSSVKNIQLLVEKLHNLIHVEGQQLEQIYNADKTRLFWRVLPPIKHCLAEARRRLLGGRGQRRMLPTLLGCVNTTGRHKLTPVLIGKTRNQGASSTSIWKHSLYITHHWKMNGPTVILMTAGSIKISVKLWSYTFSIWECLARWFCSMTIVLLILMRICCLATVGKFE